jgi:hypothetical protein
VSAPSKLVGPLVAVALAAACGAGSRPPTLGDGSNDGGAHGTSSGGSLVSDASLQEKSCNLGPDGGVCACADEPLLGDPPTIYFVLDRSGSMSEDAKWVTEQLVLEKLWIELGPRVKVAAAIFPGAASADSCATGAQVFPTAGLPPVRGDAPSGTAGPNEQLFLQTLGSISAYGGTPTAAALSALTPTIGGISGKKYVVLATDGGANCDSTTTCTVDTCTYNMENQANCPTGGVPNCCDPAEGGDVRGCLDANPTLEAVTALAELNIPVYVVGLVGSGTYAALLDQLATAGGTSRGSEPLYYDVTTTDQAALLATMSKIAAKIAGTCTLTLNQVPPDATLINVFLDGAVLPQSGDNGWTLVGDVVTILGASCQQILDGDVLDVRVVAGCPTVEL